MFMGDSIMICLSNRPIKIDKAHVDVSQIQLGLLLNYISLPIFLLTKDRHLVYANAAGHEQLAKSAFAHLHMDRFQVLGDADQVCRFEDVVRAATECGARIDEKPNTITIGEAGAAKASVTIIPFAEGPPRTRLAVVILTAQDDCETVVKLRLQQTFDLTPSEARVAYLVSSGQRPKLIASHLKISVNTVRTHLAKVFAKTGCPDQVTFCLLVKQLLTPVRVNL
jgi:DNA-binding CsgD family transcriptional regulator